MLSARRRRHRKQAPRRPKAAAAAGGELAREHALRLVDGPRDIEGTDAQEWRRRGWLRGDKKRELGSAERLGECAEEKRIAAQGARAFVLLEGVEGRVDHVEGCRDGLLPTRLDFPCDQKNQGATKTWVSDVILQCV